MVNVCRYNDESRYFYHAMVNAMDHVVHQAANIFIKYILFYLTRIILVERLKVYFPVTIQRIISLIIDYTAYSQTIGAFQERNPTVNTF